MNLKQLNGWQQVGIVVSIVWAIGAAIYQRNADVERAQNFANYAYKVCTDTKSLSHDNELASCSQEREKNMAVWLKGSWGNVAIVSLAPIPFGWLAAYIFIGIWRGAVIGFRAVVPWATMTLSGKLFVVSGALFSFVVVAFGVITALNLYVDTLVPVTLGYRAIVVEGPGGVIVEATGTWTREGATEGSKVGFPLQTSRILCNQQQRRCTEARASVSFGNLLVADLVEYEIESWSDTTIVFKDENLCGSTVFTIDRKTESVNGVGHLTNMDTDYCKRFFATRENTWTFRLTDGFKVYWEQRQKARPLPLRLVHTLFGN